MFIYLLTKVITYQCLVNNSLFSKIDQHKCLNHQTFEVFNFSFSNSSTASLNVPNILVTNTDIAIVEREVSSLFLAIRPMPFRRFAVLKYRSISIQSVLSLAAVLRFFLRVFSSLKGLPSFGPLIRIPFSLQNRMLSLVRYILSTRTLLG